MTSGHGNIISKADIARSPPYGSETSFQSVQIAEEKSYNIYTRKDTERVADDQNISYA